MCEVYECQSRLSAFGTSLSTSTASYLVRLSLFGTSSSSVALGVEPHTSNMPSQTRRAAAEPNFSFTSLPDIRQCVPVNMTWSGGTPPYTVSITSSTSSRALYRRAPVPGLVVNIEPQTTTGSYRWLPDYPGGTHGEIVITDNISNTLSALFIVSSSSDSSCLDSNMASSPQDTMPRTGSVQSFASARDPISHSPSSAPTVSPLRSGPITVTPIESTETGHLHSITTSNLRSSYATSATSASSPAALSRLPSTLIDSLPNASSTLLSKTSTISESYSAVPSNIQAATSTHSMNKAEIAGLSTALCAVAIVVLAIVLCVRLRRHNSRALTQSKPSVYLERSYTADVTCRRDPSVPLRSLLLSP